MTDCCKTSDGEVGSFRPFRPSSRRNGKENRQRPRQKHDGDDGDDSDDNKDTSKMAQETSEIANASPNKVYRRKKKLPSVSELLMHGDPETSHLPTTTSEKYYFPIIVCTLFLGSTFVFLNLLPHIEKYKNGSSAYTNEEL